MTQTTDTKTVTIRRTEYERRNPQHLIGKKAGKGYVGVYRVVVQWEVSVDGEYAFSRTRRSMAKGSAARRYAGATITFTRKDLAR